MYIGHATSQALAMTFTNSSRLSNELGITEERTNRQPQELASYRGSDRMAVMA